MAGCSDSSRGIEGQKQAERNAALEVIKAHRGKELKELDDDQTDSLRNAIVKLAPNREYKKLFSLRPWHIWDFKKNGEEPIYVLFEVNNSHPHPSSTIIRLTAFDDSPGLIWETTFDTGHRCYLRDVKLH